MSFSGDIKRELVRHIPAARHCQLAELAAVFLLCGRVRFGKNSFYWIEIRTENLTVAQKSYKLLKDVFHTSVQTRVRTHNIRGRSREYYLAVTEPDDVMSFLKAVKAVDGRTTKDSLCEQEVDCYAGVQRLIQNSCCKRSFLRGAFLVAGSLSDPRKAYHLEFAVLSEKFAKLLQDLMGFYGLEAKIVARKKYQVVYIKEGEQIADFLNVAEAHVALMEFENIRIVKEVRNSVNRQVNCETANIEKIVKAAAKQVEDIKYIECNMGLQKLARGLREIAELRLDYPDSSLQELGQMADPPIGKSGVNHRLRKLGEIADELREKAVDFSPKKEDM